MVGAEFLSVGLPVASLVGGFLESGLMDKAIVLVQIAAAIVSGAVIVRKNLELLSITRSGKRFVREFLEGRDVLDYYLLREKGLRTSLELIYDRTCERMVKLLSPDVRRSVIGRQGGAETAALSAREVALVRGTCEHTVREEKIRVERGMGFLATVSAASPMLGLLGTVWGVLDALGEKGADGARSLAAVAPAVSAALVTTVVGLLVAIPCAIFYWDLSAKVRQLSIDMDGFADELLGRIACEFQGRAD